MRFMHGITVLLAMVALAACEINEVAEVSVVNSPDCERLTDLAESGSPGDADALSMPASVEHVTTVELPAETGVEIAAGESTLAMPDPDVPKTVAVGVTSIQSSALRAEFDDLMDKRGLSIGSRSEGDTFSFGYAGPAESGSVVVRQCDRLTVMVTHTTSPPLPPADATAPSCTALVPEGLYRDTIITAEDNDHARHCYYRERGTSSLADHTVITVSRPPVNANEWRRRLQNLRRSANEQAQLACPPGTDPEETQRHTWTCSYTTSFGTVTSAATAHENDFWVSVTVEHETAVPPEAVAGLLQSAVTTIDG